MKLLVTLIGVAIARQKHQQKLDLLGTYVKSSKFYDVSVQQKTMATAMLEDSAITLHAVQR